MLKMKVHRSTHQKDQLKAMLNAKNIVQDRGYSSVLNSGLNIKAQAQSSMLKLYVECNSQDRAQRNPMQKSQCNAQVQI